MLSVGRVCLSVCPSVRHALVLHRNGYRCHQTFLDLVAPPFYFFEFIRPCENSQGNPSKAALNTTLNSGRREFHLCRRCTLVPSDQERVEREGRFSGISYGIAYCTNASRGLSSASYVAAEYCLPYRRTLQVQLLPAY